MLQFQCRPNASMSPGPHRFADGGAHRPCLSLINRVLKLNSAQATRLLLNSLFFKAGLTRRAWHGIDGGDCSEVEVIVGSSEVAVAAARGILLSPERRRGDLRLRVGREGRMALTLGFCASGQSVLPRRRSGVERYGRRRQTGVVPRRGVLMTASTGGVEGEGSAEGPSGFLRAVGKFTRPHTIRGTILGSFAGCTRALIEHRSLIDWGLIPTAFLGLLALVLGNAFIVGINQIYDVDIDKVNKPFLPIAAGELSPALAWVLVTGSLVAGMSIVYRFYSALIFKLYGFGLTLGALYSVPPFHLKRFPIAAALIISTVRGFLLNFGVYHATCAALKVPFAWNAPITFLATFMTGFAIVIAISKDIPDIKGDQTYKVETFATRLGPSNMVKIVTNLLSFNYLAAMVVALKFSNALRTSVMLPAHLLLLMVLRFRSRSVDPTSNTSIKKFYAFIWNLFYIEYLIFPFF